MTFEDEEANAFAALRTSEPKTDARSSVSSSKESSKLTETSKYFVASIDQAKKRASDLAKETSRRAGLARKELDALNSDSDHVTAFRASREFRLLKDRVCTAEKNVLIERDRYSRLLARYTELAERQADDVKRIQSLQKALSDYQDINDTLAEELDEQGSTLERLVMSIRRARSDLRQVHDMDIDVAERPADGEDSKVEADHPLQGSIRVIEELEDIWGDSTDYAEDTFPLARHKST